MDNLTAIILILWFICILGSLFTSDSFKKVFSNWIVFTFLWLIIYVIVHFVIKFW